MGMPARPRGRAVLWVSAAVLAVAAAAVLAGLYIRGGGPLPAPLTVLRPVSGDPLARSSQPEQVLRTLRLVGVDLAVAGERDGTAIVRIELPAADSSGDVAVAWQSGLAALRDAYPRARRYAVQIFGPGATPLVEYVWTGEDARSTDEPGRLHGLASVSYLPEEAR